MLRQTHTHLLDALHSLHRPVSLQARCLNATAITSAQRHRLPPELEGEDPRWLRRQTEQKKKSRERDVPPLPSKMEPPKFRSRHLTPEAAKERTKSKEGLKLLEPHVLSQRIKKLCDRGQIDEAVSLLRTSPRDAQNTIVWNGLIWEAMKLHRHQLAWLLYVDVRFQSYSLRNYRDINIRTFYR